MILRQVSICILGEWKAGNHIVSRKRSEGVQWSAVDGGEERRANEAIVLKENARMSILVFVREKLAYVKTHSKEALDEFVDA
jgi:hypothetical protein